MYVFVAGRFPFEGVSPFQMMIALNHGVLKFPADLRLSERCVGLIRELLQADPRKRIAWRDFFAHPFVALPPEKYAELLEKHQDSFLGGTEGLMGLLSKQRERINAGSDRTGRGRQRGDQGRSGDQQECEYW